MTFDDLRKIQIEPSHLVNVNMGYPCAFQGVSPFDGRKFVVSYDYGGAMAIFEGPEKLANLDIPGYWIPQIHPFEQIIAVHSNESASVLFYDYSRQRLGKFESPPDDSVFGFEQSGNFFQAGPEQIITWSKNTPIKNLGKIASAMDTIELPTDFLGSVDRPRLPGWRGLFSYQDTKRVYLNFRTHDGKIQIGSPIEDFEYGVRFSEDGSEFLIARHDNTQEELSVHRYSYRNPTQQSNKCHYQELCESINWPGWGIDLTYLEQHLPRPQAFCNIDLVRCAFVTTKGYLPILHTRSLTFEGRLEIEGIKPRQAFDLIRCGDSIAILAKSSDPNKVKLAFVNMDDISQAIEST